MSKSSPTKYVFVTGGVTSSLGKGIVSASLGKLLESRGYSVSIQKLNPPNTNNKTGNAIFIVPKPHLCLYTYNLHEGEAFCSSFGLSF